MRSTLPQDGYRNRILRKLSAADFEVLAPHFELTELQFRQTILRTNYPVTHIYFPESGQLSVLVRATTSELIEVGLIGREGMSDFAPAIRSPVDTICQAPGWAHRIRREIFAEHMKRSVTLANLMVRYTCVMQVQLSFTSLSHGSFTVEERLARWLLMAHDRWHSNALPFAQDFLSWMLGVRRSGVSDALSGLRKLGYIATQRGVITILNRDGLIHLAGGCYGPAEAEYERIFGSMNDS